VDVTTPPPRAGGAPIIIVNIAKNGARLEASRATEEFTAEGAEGAEGKTVKGEKGRSISP
jgi:hypothetical protein